MNRDEPFAKIVASLPIETFRPGESVLSAGARSGRLLILKAGAVVVLKDNIEIAQVTESGAVFGELSALLDQPHAADVRALTDASFYVADAKYLTTELDTLLHVARILARRIVNANKSVVELKNELAAGHPGSKSGTILQRIEKILSIGGASFET